MLKLLVLFTLAVVASNAYLACKNCQDTDGLSSEPTVDYTSFLSPSRWREQCSVINRGFRRCGRSYPGNNLFVLNKPVPSIPAFVIVAGPGIVPLSTRRTRRGTSATSKRQCRSCVAYGRSYRCGLLQMDSDCYRMSCDCKCDGSYSCLREKSKLCAKVLEICPSPLNESNLKKKFYKHKILFKKFSLRYQVNHV